MVSSKEVKGLSSQYFPRLEFDITMHVGLVWPIVFLFKKSRDISTSILNKIEQMLRSEGSWAKVAKPLKIQISPFLLCVLQVKCEDLQ